MADLFLELSGWDLIADADGNIAVCTEPYTIAQQVANECKLFTGEGYYLPLAGIPYNEEVLGAAPNMGLLQSLMQNAAMQVPGVVSAHAPRLRTSSTKSEP